MQLPRFGRKLNEAGELEGMEGESGISSEYLGTEKYTVDGCVVTKPNDKHVQNIKTKLGMEDAKAGVLPGRKLGASIYLSQDRADLKFAVKELARRLHALKRCDVQNLKVFARYRAGTKNYGHVSKLADGLDPCDPLPLHAYTDSDWAGCEETRKSSSGELTFFVSYCRRDKQHDTTRRPSDQFR